MSISSRAYRVDLFGNRVEVVRNGTIFVSSKSTSIVPYSRDSYCATNDLEFR